MEREQFLLCITTKDWNATMEHSVDNEDGDTEHEWWNSSGEEGFKELGLELVEKGYTYEKALEFLGGCYGCVAGEYGN